MYLTKKASAPGRSGKMTYARRGWGGGEGGLTIIRPRDPVGKMTYTSGRVNHHQGRAARGKGWRE
eukprot:366370-Chlamydomonas_euryale.AAC.1